MTVDQVVFYRPHIAAGVGKSVDPATVGYAFVDIALEPVSIRIDQ